MTIREDEVTALYEDESGVPALAVIIHPTETLFLDWADYVNLMEQLLGERYELEAEGVVTIKKKAPTAEEVKELKAWLEGVGTR